jgi:hypothetical protein
MLVIFKNPLDYYLDNEGRKEYKEGLLAIYKFLGVK